MRSSGYWSFASSSKKQTNDLSTEVPDLDKKP